MIPHVALHVPDEELKPYLKLNWNDPPFVRDGGYGYTPHFTPRAAYASMITRMDRYIGNVLQTLEELGLSENTIVIFTSDNGTTHLKKEVDYDFFKSVGELRGLKGSLFEGGIRVPLIVKWPEKIQHGTTSDVVTGLEDWLPTLLELLGASKEIPKGVDGISIAPALLQGEEIEREFLYREFSGYGGQQAVWLRDWKGIRPRILRKNNQPLKIELYNLREDPSESEDIAVKHPEIVAEIRAIMLREHVPSQQFPIAPLDKLAESNN